MRLVMGGWICNGESSRGSVSSDVVDVILDWKSFWRRRLYR
jgi:hypothetical protein